MARLLSAKLYELVHRFVSFDKSKGVYLNGRDNAYSERVERIINNSSTAKPATTLFRKFLVGRGFGILELDNFIVHKPDKTKLTRFLYDISESYSYQKGVFIHINYNLDARITGLKVLPFSHCKIGKKDDSKYHGKIAVYENWTGEKIKKDKIQLFDVFNSEKSIVLNQIEKQGGIEKYKGQIFFYNPEKTIYPLAHLDNVLNDADSEYRASQFKNTSLRKGFFGKTVVVTPPMIDGDINEENLSEGERLEYRRDVTERENFKKTMQSFVGVDNLDGMLHLELEFEGDDIEKYIKFITLETNIDDKLFEYTEGSSSKNIAKSLGIPYILIDTTSQSLFVNSGELLKSAEEYFQKQKEEDIKNLESEIINPLMLLFEGFTMPENGLEIIPLIEIRSDELNK